MLKLIVWSSSCDNILPPVTNISLCLAWVYSYFTHKVSLWMKLWLSMITTRGKFLKSYLWSVSSLLKSEVEWNGKSCQEVFSTLTTKYKWMHDKFIWCYSKWNVGFIKQLSFINTSICVVVERQLSDKLEADSKQR